MTKFKQNSDSNVVQFRLRTENHPIVFNPTSQSNTQPLVLTRMPRTSSEQVLRGAAIMDRHPKRSQEENEQELQILLHKGAPPSSELADEIAAMTIQRVLHLAKKNNIRKKKLSRLVQNNIDLMCEYKHPAGLILQDWLDGNRRLLPENFATMTQSLECPKEPK